MALQRLSPGMQNAEEAELRSETGRIGRDFQQRCSTSFKQETEEKLLVLPYQRYQRMGNAEDEMEVADRQQFLSPGA